MQTAIRVLDIILKILVFISVYKFVYMIIGFFRKEKTFSDTEKKHKYAVVICARNEEKVIGNLLDSIAAQDYPQEQLHVFVIADNCNDGTAAIAREKGATVYERHNPKKARKGYALEFGFAQIQAEFGIESFEGYLFFDADNLLRSDYITQMNKAFDEGKLDVITGYRNTKNFDTNFISAGYGIHFYRSTLSLHRPRQILKTATHLAGTGYLVRSEILKDGWKWHCLTEDTQLTLDLVAQGKKIGFCEAAEFYDEQPVDFWTVIKQRMRWIKGRLYAFFAYAHKEFTGMFRKKTNKWSCFDMIFYAFPYGLITTLISLAITALSVVIAVRTGNVMEAYGPIATLKGLGKSILSAWLIGTFTATVVVIRERKHIQCSKPKLILYVLLFFWFDLIDVPLALISLFVHVTWRKIKHEDTTRIEDLVPGANSEIPVAPLAVTAATPSAQSELSKSVAALPPPDNE